MSVSACFLQHIEDASEIQELGKYKPHVLLTQENTQIKELQQENKGTKRRVLSTTRVVFCITSVTLLSDWLCRTVVVS